MWFDERLIFNRNNVVNQDRELYSVTPLRFSNMLHVVRNSPTSANRDDHIAAAHKPLKPVLPGPCSDGIASCSLEDRKEKSRMPHDHRDRSGEFSPKYCRLPKCLPRSCTARRAKVCGPDCVEADSVESLAINTEPTKPHAFGQTVECLGCTVKLK